MKNENQDDSISSVSLEENYRKKSAEKPSSVFLRENVLKINGEKISVSENVKETNMDKTSFTKINTKSKLKQLRATFFEWSTSCDINCFAKIFETQNVFAKFFWFVVLLLSMLLTSYLIASSLINYYSFEVVTTTKIINEIPSDLPVVTVCINEPFMYSYSDSIFLELINGTGFNPYDYYATQIAKMGASNPSFDKNKKLTIGLLGTNIQTQRTGINKTWYYSFDYGSCWQFNSGLNPDGSQADIMKNYEPGPDPNYLSFIFTGNPGSFSQYQILYQNGFVVFIHHQSFKPLPSDQIKVDVTKKSFISIKRTLVYKQPYPYSDCFDLTLYRSDFYDFIINSNQTYRQVDCFDLCKQDIFISKCGCFYTRYPNMKNQIRPCMSMSDFNCFREIEALGNYDLDKCALNSCPLECNSVRYDVTISNLNSILSSYSLGFIDVFYQSLAYTEITEIPKMVVIDLLGQIGGNLGMFISLSVFSLLEIAEILIFCLFVLFKK